VRYPLFWIVGLIALGVLGRAVWPLTRPWRETWSERWTRVVEGPPVPSSPSPQVWAGPITRRGLLLRENVTASSQPGGSPAETIGRRVFVSIYDVWPLSGPVAHYRVGNSRRAFGWVPEEVLLPWDTRLVVQLPSEPVSQPVLSWDGDRLLLAVWSPAEPWSRVERQAWAERSDAGRPGVLISRPELLFLLRRLMSDEPAAEIRIRALIGQLAEAAALPAGEMEAARRVLPAWMLESEGTGRDDLVARLSRRNEQWTPEAAWSGLEFLAVPLDELP
jgi:hypothetical protein